LHSGHFFRRFNGLLDLFLGRIHFGLDGAHLGIDTVPDIGHGLSEGSQHIAHTFA
jgi:hypothetical protein